MPCNEVWRKRYDLFFIIRDVTVGLGVIYLWISVLCFVCVLVTYETNWYLEFQDVYSWKHKHVNYCINFNFYIKTIFLLLQIQFENFMVSFLFVAYLCSTCLYPMLISC